MKEQMKRLELEKQAQEAVMKVAKQGEPLDPEMLNPARKRPLQKVYECISFRHMDLVQNRSKRKLDLN